MTKKKNILIADEDEDVLVNLERTLEDAGYDTTTAWSGRQAVELLKELPFDLLLIDENLSDFASAMVLWRMNQFQRPVAVILMHTRNRPSKRVLGLAQTTLCKWEHEEVKSRVRDCLAA